MYSFRRTEGWYDGRPVAAGSTPSKLISARSSASTNASITRTGLFSLMKSSRHSGNSVHCPRSASSTKRLISFSRRITRESRSRKHPFCASWSTSRRLRAARHVAKDLYSAVIREQLDWVVKATHRIFADAFEIEIAFDEVRERAG